MTVKDAKAAAAEVKAGKATPKEAVEKAKKKTAERKASGKERDEKRVGAKQIWARYNVLPSMKMGAKLEILETALKYLAKEVDALPAELANEPAESAESEE